MNTVLVIDDDHELRGLICQILKKADLIVFEASNGDVGLSLFREHRPDLVITDIVMPHKDGIDTIREIKAISPQTPIIAMSGHDHPTRPNALGLARKLGAVETLIKPFHLNWLLEVVARVLSNSDATRTSLHP